MQSSLLRNSRPASAEKIQCLATRDGEDSRAGGFQEFPPADFLSLVNGPFPVCTVHCFPLSDSCLVAVNGGKAMTQSIFEPGFGQVIQNSLRVIRFLKQEEFLQDRPIGMRVLQRQVLGPWVSRGTITGNEEC